MRLQDRRGFGGQALGKGESVCACQAPQPSQPVHASCPRCLLTYPLASSTAQSSKCKGVGWKGAEGSYACHIFLHPSMSLIVLK